MGQYKDNSGTKFTSPTKPVNGTKATATISGQKTSGTIQSGNFTKKK